MAKNSSVKYFTVTSCPLCGEKKYIIMYPSTLTDADFSSEVIRENLKNSLDDYTKHGQIVRCTRCNLVYVNPSEDIDKLLQGYEDVKDFEYLAMEKYRKLLLLEHLQGIERWKSSGTILDVGCFAGFFLTLAKKHGWKAFGIEPSKWAVAYAEKQGVTILGKDIETTKLPANYFDAITLWDVIEHLPHPKKTIDKLHSSLKRGGILAMGTPNIESLFARILGKKCPFLIRMHVILYSPKTLSRLLEEYGFRVLSVKTYGRIFPLSYLLQRIKANNVIFSSIKTVILHIPRLSDLPIRLNFRDSFVIIAKKI